MKEEFQTFTARFVAYYGNDISELNELSDDDRADVIARIANFNSEPPVRVQVIFKDLANCQGDIKLPRFKADVELCLLGKFIYEQLVELEAILLQDEHSHWGYELIDVKNIRVK